MRFMLVVKAGKNLEAGVLPSQELIATVEKLNQETACALGSFSLIKNLPAKCRSGHSLFDQLMESQT